MAGFTTNLNRTVAKQAKKIKYLEAKISTQDEEIKRLSELNGRLMADQQVYATEIERLEIVKQKYNDGIDEMKKLRDKYQQAIFEARNIKKEYTKRFKKQIQRIKSQE